MQILENHKEDFLFVARLIAFLGPMWIIAELYSIFKNRAYKTRRVARLIIAIVLVILSYAFLNSHDRLYISLEIVVAIIVFSVVFGAVRIVKFRK